MIVLRPGTEADLPVVKDAWVRSFTAGGSRKIDGETWTPVARAWLSPSLFLSAQRSTVDEVLGQARLLVAHDAPDPEIVLGWVAFDPGSPTTVHYVWVRKALRRRGYGLALLKSAAAVGGEGVRFSHMTKDGQALAEKMGTP